MLIALSNGLFKEGEKPKGGPKIDYAKLFNNLEVWNATYGRLISLKAIIRLKNKMRTH